MSKASDTQVGGDHYKKLGEHQPWDVLQTWLTPEEYRGWQKGTAIVYLAREKAKGGDQDIQKALHHLQRLTETFGAPTESATPLPVINVPVCPPDDAGWVEWFGGDRPVGSDVVVEVEMRCGDGRTRRAGDLRWAHAAQRPIHFDAEYDIVRYRLHTPTTD